MQLPVSRQLYITNAAAWIFDQGVHKHYDLVDKVHFFEGGKKTNIFETIALMCKQSWYSESSPSTT